MVKFNEIVWGEISKNILKEYNIPAFNKIKLGMACIDWAFNKKGMAESRVLHRPKLYGQHKRHPPMAKIKN